jgi:hypothetical protein
MIDLTRLRTEKRDVKTTCGEAVEQEARRLLDQFELDVG